MDAWTVEDAAALLHPPLTAPEDTVAAIDDVLTDWHGSPDAATWTAEPPKRPALADFPRLHADPDAMRRAGETLAAQLQTFMEAMRPAVEQMVRNVGASWQALTAAMASPQMRELTESRRLARRAMKSEYRRRRR